MKKFLLFPILLLTISALSQSISFYPDDTTIANITPDEFKAIDIKIFNHTSDSLQIAWVAEENTFVSGWDYSLCDYGICYPGIPHNGTMTKMSTADTAFLKISINPMSIAGSGQVRFKLTPATGEDYYLTYIVNAFPLGIFENNYSSLSVSPNPASDKIQFAVVNEQLANGIIEIHTLLGEKIFSQPLLTTNYQLPTTAFRNGIYFLTLKSAEISETRKIIIAR